MRALVLLVLLVGCGGPAASGMGWRWRVEPSVGASTPTLVPLVARAVAAWRYGRALPTCQGADVCVIVGQRSHAYVRRPRCLAEVALAGPALEQPPLAVQWTVEHEIGHCYGLPHTDDPSSVMHPRPTRGVSARDRSDLAVR